MSNRNPNWSHLLLDHLDDRAQEPRRHLSLDFPDAFAGPIIRTAEARDLSLTAFARRAIMAFAVHDENLDWFAVMEEEPRLRGYRQLGRAAMDPRGHGHGPWKITRLDDYDRD